MSNLYFKLIEETDENKDLVYQRSMTMMTANNDGKIVISFYDPQKFIKIDDYFKGSEFIGRYAKRIKPIVNDTIEDISYMSEEKTMDAGFILIYANEKLGIGYDVKSESYKIVYSEYMKDYKKGGWDFAEPCLLELNEKDLIIDALIQQKSASLKPKTRKKVK